MGDLPASTVTPTTSPQAPIITTRQELPPYMEAAIKTVVMTFIQSSMGKENLDSKSFKKLVSKQLGGIMEDTESSSAIKEMQAGLDENNDGKVSFQEYLTLIGYVANSVSQRKTEANQEAS